MDRCMGGGGKETDGGRVVAGWISGWLKEGRKETEGGVLAG